MNDKKTHKLVLTALFAALVCVATMVIQIPSPMNGYVNLGDCFVLLSGWILGPVWGFFAGGAGSALADLFSGYTIYVPGTLVIKGCMALVGSLLYTGLRKVSSKYPSVQQLCSGVVAECIMVAGYFGYAALLLGNGLAAATSIPGNLVQGGIGLICALVLAKLFSATPLLKAKMDRAT